MDKALEVVAGDRNLLIEIARMFMDELPRSMEAIRKGIAGGDAHAVERAAHSLKGAVSNFGAKRAFESAYHLEKMGAGGDLRNGGQAFDDLKEKSREFESEIHAFLGDQENGA